MMEWYKSQSDEKGERFLLKILKVMLTASNEMAGGMMLREDEKAHGESFLWMRDG